MDKATLISEITEAVLNAIKPKIAMVIEEHLRELDITKSHLSKEDETKTLSLFSKKEKYVKHISPEVVVCLNYTSKVHALFGDFSKTHSIFKEDFLCQNKWIQPRTGLEFGVGWTFVYEHLKEVEGKLTEFKIPYKKFEKTEYEKILNATEDKTDKPPSEPTKKKKRTIGKNKWGNREEKETGFVFLKLPLGEDDAPIPIVVGFQDPTSKKEGLESVLPLDDKSKKECEKVGWNYLTEDMLKRLAKLKPMVTMKLRKMMQNTSSLEEDDSGSE